MVPLIRCVFYLRLDVFDKKDIGYGYYEFQRQKLAFVMIGLPGTPIRKHIN